MARNRSGTAGPAPLAFATAGMAFCFGLGGAFCTGPSCEGVPPVSAAGGALGGPAAGCFGAAGVAAAAGGGAAGAAFGLGAAAPCCEGFPPPLPLPPPPWPFPRPCLPFPAPLPFCKGAWLPVCCQPVSRDQVHSRDLARCSWLSLWQGNPAQDQLGSVYQEFHHRCTSDSNWSAARSRRLSCRAREVVPLPVGRPWRFVPGPAR